MPAAAHREQWPGRIGFVLATIGSAVGLGSIWTFPYSIMSVWQKRLVFRSLTFQPTRSRSRF
ncbi:MAG: hypothetical protein ABW003_07495 [Microvirga sp.]